MLNNYNLNTQNKNNIMKTKRIIPLALMAAIFLISFKANAQSDSKKFSAGFGLEGGLPVGSDTKAAYKADGGITIRLAYHAGPGFITLTSGLVGYYPNTAAGESVKASLQIPVKAGYKYVIASPLFIMGEVGFSSFKSYFPDGNGNVASSSVSGFTYAPTIGVTFKALELGVKYEAISVTGGNISNVALRLGFNF